MIRALPLIVVVLALGGCGSLGGWFGGEETTKTRPAPLPDIKPTLALVKAWEANVGPAHPYVFSPASDGEAVFAASRDGRLVKLDPATGRELWRVESGRTLSAGVGVGEGLVLVGTPKGELIAYRSENGLPAWTARLSGEILTPPVAGGGLVVARANDGNIWLLDARDGKSRWFSSRPLPALILRQPGNLLLTGQAVYAGHPGGKLSALSLANGAPLWETNLALPHGATELERIADVTGAMAADAGRICAAAYQGRIACYEPVTGSLIWVRDFSSLTGVEMGERFLFAADDHDVVQSFDKQRGASLWRQDALRERRLCTPRLVAGLVAVADYQGYVHLLSLEEGALVARAATDGSAVPGQMLPLNRGLIVQTANGGIHAFKIQ